ncbi:MAG: hypothetical protein C0502_04990 [Opitutus sp.]|nr:hypothetical protein [Opitutus sp.]
MARRTVEWALAWLRRSHWQERFAFRKLRVGRVYVVEVSDRNPRPLSPTPPIPAVRSERFGNTAGRISAETARGKLGRLAAFLARHELAPAHWDNCKVRFGFGHAFNFALSALVRGFDRNRIRRAYESALHRRHRDATDLGLNTGRPTTVRWEPSSTVSLARTLLADGREDAERIAEQIDRRRAETDRVRAECRAGLAAALATPFAT